MVVFGQKWLYSGKVDVFNKSGFNPAKVVLFGLSGSIREILVEFLQSGCIRAKWLYSG